MGAVVDFHCALIDGTGGKVLVVVMRGSFVEVGLSRPPLDRKFWVLMRVGVGVVDVGFHFAADWSHDAIVDFDVPGCAGLVCCQLDGAEGVGFAFAVRTRRPKGAGG